MADIRIKKLAEMLVHYSVSVQRKQRVLIEYDDLAAPLAREIYREVLKIGAYPYLLARPSWKNEDFFRLAQDNQINYIHSVEKAFIKDFDADIVLCADENTKALSNVDSAKMSARSLARVNLIKLHRDRSARGELKWVLCNYPTHALAQDAQMSLAEYEDFLYDACLIDINDPQGAWQKIQKRQDDIIKVLSSKDLFELDGSNAKLSIRAGGRIWKNSCGHYNVPDGEIFTSPVENSAEGYIRFSYPAIYRGKEVSGVEMWFKRGRVIKVKAEQNEDYMLSVIDTDDGARFLGEFAFGTNNSIKRFSKDILFDEKIGGTIHLALGSSYPETGGKNDSVVHWDMICDMRDGVVKADGQIIYQNGDFVI